MKDKIKRIENLLKEEEGRQEKDPAGVYIPINMDAKIKIDCFKQVLRILKDDTDH